MVWTRHFRNANPLSSFTLGGDVDTVPAAAEIGDADNGTPEQDVVMADVGGYVNLKAEVEGRTDDEEELANSVGPKKLNWPLGAAAAACGTGKSSKIKQSKKLMKISPTWIRAIRKPDPIRVLRKEKDAWKWDFHTAQQTWLRNFQKALCPGALDNEKLKNPIYVNKPLEVMKEIEEEWFGNDELMKFIRTRRDYAGVAHTEIISRAKDSFERRSALLRGEIGSNVRLLAKQEMKIKENEDSLELLFDSQDNTYAQIENNRTKIRMQEDKIKDLEAVLPEEVD
jgi:hypothetical protein